MWVTCYTDASFSRRKGGGWAVWLRSDAGRLVRRGRCPRYVRTSNDAELAAIYAGVHLAVASWGDRVSTVLVCSDSRGALRLANREAELARGRAARRLQELLRQTLREHDVGLRLRWVRGHQTASSVPAHLNATCDRLARAARHGERRRSPRS